MDPILPMSMWVSLESDVRTKIRREFAIPRSAHVEVEDLGAGHYVRSDGTTPQDFQHLTVKKMQAFLDSEDTDFFKLFNSVVEKVKNDLVNPPIVVTPGLEVAPETPEIVTQTPAPIVEEKPKVKIIKKINEQKTNPEV